MARADSDKEKRDFRLSKVARDQLARIAEHFGLSETAAFELIMREVARRDFRAFLTDSASLRVDRPRLTARELDAEHEMDVNAQAQQNSSFNDPARTQRKAERKGRKNPFLR